MPNNILKILIVNVVCLLLFSGCITTQNLLTTEDYTKQTVPNQQTNFRRVWAIEDDDGKFNVSGRLYFNGSRNNAPRYVEVALIDEAGTIIEKQKVTYKPRTFRRKKSRRRGAKFIAHFSEMPPPGTIIRLSNVN